MDTEDREVKVATFHNQYGALQFRRRVENVKLRPVPRSLSSSCGTAAFFYQDFEESMADDNTEAVYIKKGDEYERIWENG